MLHKERSFQALVFKALLLINPRWNCGFSVAGRRDFGETSLPMLGSFHKSSHLSHLNSNTYLQLPLSTLHTPSDPSNQSS